MDDDRLQSFRGHGVTVAPGRICDSVDVGLRLGAELNLRQERVFSERLCQCACEERMAAIRADPAREVAMEAVTCGGARCSVPIVLAPATVDQLVRDSSRQGLVWLGAGWTQLHSPAFSHVQVTPPRLRSLSQSTRVNAVRNIRSGKHGVLQRLGRAPATGSRKISQQLLIAPRHLALASPQFAGIAATLLNEARLGKLADASRLPYVWRPASPLSSRQESGTARARSLNPEFGIAQQHLTTFDIDGKQYDVTIRGEYDGIEHVAKLYFSEAGGSSAGIPDRGVFSGTTLGEAIERARRLTHEDLTRRLKRAQAAKRRFFQLRHAVEEMLENVKYMNRVATSVRAGIIDLEGGNQELDLIEGKLIATVRRLRSIAGVEG